ncbi:MAG: hypothetical protein K0S33_2315 [Bacteroidetes bacterium]|jgi:hypothetical protein|nr:hypothetical protein [Bacteroidota bacterium]
MIDEFFLYLYVIGVVKTGLLEPLYNKYQEII